MSFTLVTVPIISAVAFTPILLLQKIKTPVQVHGDLFEFMEVLIISGVSLVLVLILIRGCLLIWAVNQKTIEQKENEEYKNSLYYHIRGIIPKLNESSKILIEFADIAHTILSTEKGSSISKENMRYFDEQAYNEILALKEISIALNKGIPIMDETILNTLKQVGERLQKHYDLYYQNNLNAVKEELYILTELEK